MLIVKNRLQRYTFYITMKNAAGGLLNEMPNF